MRLAAIFSSALLVGAAGCDPENATTIVVDNDYPAAEGGGAPSGENTVLKAWWVDTFLPDPVAPGGEGQSERTVPGRDFAYVVLAPGWDPSSPNPPTTLVALKSAAPLSASRGDTIHLRVSDLTFVGNCAAGKPLSQDDADLLTTRLFPDDFAGMTYDAASCTATRVGDDAGAAALDAGSNVEGVADSE